MSPLFSCNNIGIPNRLLSGNSTLLFVGDSIGVQLESGWALTWPNPPNGCGMQGGDFTFFSSDSLQTQAIGGLLQTGAGLAYSSNKYSPWSTREYKFTGSAYGAVSTFLSNRIADSADGSLIGLGGGGRTGRATACVDGLDWMAQCNNLTMYVGTYGDSSALLNLVRPYMRMQDQFSTVPINLGTPNTTGGYKMSTGSCLASVATASQGCSFCLRVDAGTPGASSSFTLLNFFIKGDRPNGVAIVPASTGGFSVGQYTADNPDTKIDPTALAAYQNMGVTDVVFEMTTNGSKDNTGQFANAAYWKNQVNTWVSQVRTYLPNVSITFIAVHDTDNTGGFQAPDGQNLASKVDALYQVQKATRNSMFINAYRYAGAWSTFQATYLSDGIHLNSSGIPWEINNIKSVMSQAARSSGGNNIAIYDLLDIP